MPTNKLKNTMFRFVLATATIGGTEGFFGPLRAQPPAPSGKPAKQEQPERPRADQLGDPLPPGALSRMGTQRFYCGYQSSNVVYSPDGRFLATSDTFSEIILWEAATGRELRRLRGHGSAKVAMVFSPDSKLLISTGYDAIVRFQEAATGKEIDTLTFPERNNYIFALTSDGSMLAIARDDVVQLWDLKRRKEIRDFEAHRGSIDDLRFTADGRALLTSSRDGTRRFWDVATGKKIRQVGSRTEHQEIVFLSPDGTILATKDWDRGKEISVWDTATGKVIQRLKTDHEFYYYCAFSPDGKHLAYTGTDRQVGLWDVSTRKDLPALDAGYADCVAFSPDGKTLATVADRKVRLWQVATGKELLRRPGHTNRVISVAFTPDGKTLRTCGYEGTHAVWDAASGKLLEPVWIPPFKMEYTSQFDPAVSNDGRLFTGIDPEGQLDIWNVAIGKKVRHFEKEDGYYNTHLSFSPDATKLVVNNGALTLWDATTGKVLR